MLSRVKLWIRCLHCLEVHDDDIPLDDVESVVEPDKCFASSRVLSMDCDCGAPEKEKGAGFVGPASLRCGNIVLKARDGLERLGMRLTSLREAIIEGFIQLQYYSLGGQNISFLPGLACGNRRKSKRP